MEIKDIKNIYYDYAPKLNEVLTIEDLDFIEKKDTLYLNNITSFDIETTSVFYNSKSEKWESYIEENKDLYTDYNALCYCWSFAIRLNNERIISFFGRTLESFKQFLNDFEELAPDAIKIIYVHNLKFEFQFMRNILQDMTVFAREVREPIYACWEHFTFRCSYMLTQLSLENWAKTKNLKHQKLVGDLDYSVERTPYTEMSEEEIKYSLVDTIIVCEGLVDYMKEYGTVENIPLTQTGRVRRHVEKSMLKNYKWHDKMFRAYPKNISDYKDLTDVFWGGLTRANRLHAGTIHYNLASRDATSAYPWIMLSKLFPVTEFVETQNYKYVQENENLCYYVTVEFYDLKSIFWNSYIPLDKCITTHGVVADNGRIIEAEYVKIKILDIDFEIIQNSYKMSKYEIIDMHYALKGYLDNDFRMEILNFFRQKTQYKDVAGKEELYMRSKEMLNSLYGMMVTKVFNNDVYLKDNEWCVDNLTLDSFNEKLENELKRKYKLNYIFSMGAYVTAYQRQSLWNFVYRFDELLVYMDTDSHKYISTSETERYYLRYNKAVYKTYQLLSDQLGVEVEAFTPKAPNGKISLIGQYTPEPTYSEFKTLGAKRYAYKYQGDTECHVTISGVNKKSGGLALKGDLNNFKENMIFNNEYCKKLSMHYLDSQKHILYREGYNDVFNSHYNYGICAEPSTYTMGLHGYMDLILEAMQLKSQLPLYQLRGALKEYETDKH